MSDDLIQHLRVQVPEKMISLPTESLTLGDILYLNHSKLPTLALLAVLEADATLQNKTFAIVRQTNEQTTIVCVRTPDTIWPHALDVTPAKNLIGEYRNKRFSALQRGNKLCVVNFADHPFFPYKPLNLAGLRVYACKVGKQSGLKFVVSKTAYGAEVMRVA